MSAPSKAELRAQALAVIKAATPMPSDAELDAMDAAAAQDLLQRYGDAVTVLLDVMDDSCVRPLLDSLGHGYAFGIYDVARHAIESRSRDVVRPALQQALLRGRDGPRMWATALMESFGGPDDVPLLELLANEPDGEVRYFAARALGAIGDPRALDVLRQLQNDRFAPVREAATAALEAMTGGH